LYERGEGVPLDPSEAYKWLSIAARSGDKDAAREATALRQDLSEAQRQKADAAVAAFKPAGEVASANP
ncbi:MAG: SEL1-like repeat protein, partial [Asticcacaulis sp.]|nr:SEL1-like repeat protein [Asticcacaulis sp.]